MITTSIERLEQIEQERNETMSDAQFREWLKQLNVSRLYTNNEGILNAKRIMEQWDNEENKRCSYFNF
jgi:hypothetical protein